MVVLGEEAAKHAPTVAKHALISKHAPVDGKKFCGADKERRRRLRILKLLPGEEG